MAPKRCIISPREGGGMGSRPFKYLAIIAVLAVFCLAGCQAGNLEEGSESDTAGALDGEKSVFGISAITDGMSSLPAEGAQVPIEASFCVSFSAPADPSFKLKCDNDNIAGSVRAKSNSDDIEDNEYCFVPGEDLGYGASCDLTVRGTSRDGKRTSNTVRVHTPAEPAEAEDDDADEDCSNIAGEYFFESGCSCFGSNASVAEGPLLLTLSGGYSCELKGERPNYTCEFADMMGQLLHGHVKFRGDEFTLTFDDRWTRSIYSKSADDYSVCFDDKTYVEASDDTFNSGDHNPLVFKSDGTFTWSQFCSNCRWTLFGRAVQLTCDGLGTIMPNVSFAGDGSCRLRSDSIYVDNMIQVLSYVEQ